MNFRQFVRTLARFKRAEQGHEHEMNTREKKIDCKYFAVLINIGVKREIFVVRVKL